MRLYFINYSGLSETRVSTIGVTCVLWNMAIRCLLGYHKGNVEPAHAIDKEIDGRVAFVCSLCGKVIE